jgi:hypothetical protein
VGDFEETFGSSVNARMTSDVGEGPAEPVDDLERRAEPGIPPVAGAQVVPDVHRASPSGPAPRGAQWNEVEDRWERWDEASESWVEATVESEAPEAT